MKLTTHLLLVPRSRKHGATPPTPTTSSWRGESLNSSVGKGTRLLAGRSGFDSRRGLGIFLITASRPALGPTQPPIQWVPGTISPGVVRLGREAHHSSSPNAEVKNAWHYTSNPQYVFMVWCSVKHMDGRLYLHFYLYVWRLTLQWFGHVIT
jgi:hypothetical protein